MGIVESLVNKYAFPTGQIATTKTQTAVCQKLLVRNGLRTEEIYLSITTPKKTLCDKTVIYCHGNCETVELC